MRRYLEGVLYKYIITLHPRVNRPHSPNTNLQLLTIPARIASQAAHYPVNLLDLIILSRLMLPSHLRSSNKPCPTLHHSSGIIFHLNSAPRLSPPFDYPFDN